MRPFQVTMLLADSAQAVDGKLYVLGGGWSLTGPSPQQSALAIHIRVPQSLADQRHKMLIELVDADGAPVFVGTQDGRKAMRVEGAFEVSGTPETEPDDYLEMVTALNLAPIPLQPGKRYVWRLSINGETAPDWNVTFRVREATQASGSR